MMFLNKIDRLVFDHDMGSEGEQQRYIVRSAIGYFDDCNSRAPLFLCCLRLAA